jgi:putative ABC transport system permease protein
VFFLTYLRRELRRRMRQFVVIALGLAVGIGLVLTVTAASAGVEKAQSDVLSSLYGVGTDVTVTGGPPAPAKRGGEHGATLLTGESVQMGATGLQMCKNGRCRNASGQTIELLSAGSYGPFGQPAVASVAKLRHVTGAAGGLTLTEDQATIPANFGPGSGQPQISSVRLNGVDLANRALGPLSLGTITSGRSLRASDARSDVAVMDSGYATSRRLTVGSTVTIGRKFTVVGIVAQPQGSNPVQVYIPLPRAEPFTLADGTSLTNKVNTTYVTAASAAGVPAVRNEIERLLPGGTVTTASSVASQVTGSLSSTAKLANDLGKWLSVLVLIAAFAVASLLTMSAVGRRVREFGTLKALGWRSRRIITQMLGESVSVGLAGGAAGVGLGYLGAATIQKIAPTLSATTIAAAAGQQAGHGPLTFFSEPGQVRFWAWEVRRRRYGSLPRTVCRLITSAMVLPGYTSGVKTAISVPDDTFEQATKQAAELGISRSEFFAQAARRYLDELASRSLTQQVDDALAAAGTDDSAAVAADTGRKRLAAEDDW